MSKINNIHLLSDSFLNDPVNNFPLEESGDLEWRCVLSGWGDKYMPRFVRPVKFSARVGSGADFISKLQKTGRLILVKASSGKEEFSRYVTIPKSIHLEFPFSEDLSEGWALSDFIILRGTKLTYSLTFGMEEGKLVKRYTVDFSGSFMQRGLWGPFSGDDFKKGEPFPGKRIDRLRVTRYYDTETKKSVPYLYRGDEYPSKVEVWATLRDGSSGEKKDCVNFFARLLAAKCDAFRSGSYRKDVTAHVNFIFKNIERFRSDESESNMLISAAEKFGIPAEKMSLAVKLTALVYHLVHESLKKGGDGREDKMEERIRAMEQRMGSQVD